MALRSVRTTWSWPTTSAKVRGRWRRYSETEAGTGSLSLVGREAVPELAQGPVDPSLDRRQRLLQQLGHLRHREVGAEAQGDRLALLRAQLRERAVELVAMLDAFQAGVGRGVAAGPRSAQRA